MACGALPPSNYHPIVSPFAGKKAQLGSWCESLEMHEMVFHLNAASHTQAQSQKYYMLKLKTHFIVYLNIYLN